MCSTIKNTVVTTKRHNKNSGERTASADLDSHRDQHRQWPTQQNQIEHHDSLTENTPLLSSYDSVSPVAVLLMLYPATQANPANS